MANIDFREHERKLILCPCKAISIPFALSSTRAQLMIFEEFIAFTGFETFFVLSICKSMKIKMTQNDRKYCRKKKKVLT